MWRARLGVANTDPVALHPCNSEWGKKGEPISTETFKSWVFSKLGEHGYDKKDFYGVSCRKGGAQAGELAQLESDLISLAGSWATKESQLRYSGPQINRLMGVTAQIFRASKGALL